MTVTVFLPGSLRELNDGLPSVLLDAAPATVADAFETLRGSRPALYRSVMTETGELRPHVNVFVGDTEIRRVRGLETPLESGSEIVILPAVSGG